MKKQESKLRSDDKKYLHTDVLPKSEALGINDKRIFSYRRITRE